MRSDTDRRVTVATIACLVLLAVPLVAALISVSRETWHPTGDMAQAELHVAGFFSHPPLVGAAGRIGDVFAPYGQGSHPGPAMWFALLPAYLVTGRSSFGMELGMTLMQLAFIVATVVVVRRLIGLLGGLLTAVVATVLVHAMGPAVFIEPWNPWGGVFAFFAFVALCWGIICGRHRWLPAAAFCGFFALQCHTGYALLVVASLIAVSVHLGIEWRRARRLSDERGANESSAILMSWCIALGVTVLMWLPALVDQLRRDPGNLRILWHHFIASTEPDGSARSFVGLGAAVKAFAGEIALPGPWIRGDFREPAEAPNLLGLLVAIAVIVGSVTLVVRRRDIDDDNDHQNEDDDETDRQGPMLIRLLTLVGALSIVGIISTARVFGEFYDYVIRWWWVIAAWIFLACALVLIRWVRPQLVVIGALAIAAISSGVATVNAVGYENPGQRNSRIVGGIDAIIRPELDTGERYLIRWNDPATLGGVPFGMLLDLEKHGFHVGVDAASAAGALPHRVVTEASANQVLWVVLGNANIERMRARPDATEFGYFDQRSREEINRSDALRQRLIDRLTELDLSCLVPKIDEQYGLASFFLGSLAIPHDVAVIAADYNDYGLPVAVFALPPFALPVAGPAASC
ncbi:MAG: hypothetical protein ABI894_12480 [Ilumatobacteraceae bacterium]